MRAIDVYVLSHDLDFFFFYFFFCVKSNFINKSIWWRIINNVIECSMFPVSIENLHLFVMNYYWFFFSSLVWIKFYSKRNDWTEESKKIRNIFFCNGWLLLLLCWFGSKRKEDVFVIFVKNPHPHINYFVIHLITINNTNEILL